LENEAKNISVIGVVRSVLFVIKRLKTPPI
jgi:hypothetical protein